MLQKTFSIYNDGFSNCSLFIEIGNQHIACWCKSAETLAVHAFELFRFEAVHGNEFEHLLHEVKLLSKFIGNDYRNVSVIWDTEEISCFPAEYYGDNDAVGTLNFMFGDAPGTKIHTQELDDKVILSRIENIKYQAVCNQFSQATHLQKFFVLLKNYFSHDCFQNNIITAFFYSGYFLLCVIKENELQLIRRVRFQTPEDVLYILLNVCKQYDMPVSETRFKISGMIDKQSNLFKLIYQYISDLEIEETPTALLAAEEFSQYPSHFFTPFIRYDV